MNYNNSGLIYSFPLEHGFGQGFCCFNDYTDMAPFSGLLVSVYRKMLQNSDSNMNLDEIKTSGILFGPLPLNKKPNIKGKGAWKLAGKTDHTRNAAPVFKSTGDLLALIRQKDWAKIGKWSLVSNFKNYSEYCDYEQLRSLETLMLYDMRGIEIRTTMHALVLQQRKVGDFYDLGNENIRLIFLQMANTSFSKKEAAKLLADLP